MIEFYSQSNVVDKIGIIQLRTLVAVLFLDKILSDYLLDQLALHEERFVG